MKRWIPLSLLLGMFTFAGLGCSQPRALETSDESQTVAVARISTGDVAQVLSIAAEFRPFQEIDVHSKVAGYVKAIYVDVGDRVRAGQLLAVLEVPELQDELRQDQAAIGRAQEEVKRAQGDLDRAESAHEVAHLSASRLSTVLKARPNLVAQQDIDEAAGRDRVSEAQVATAKAAVASALGQLEVAKAVESKTKTLLAYSQITAPFAGVITHRYADTGAMIQAGTASQTQAMPLVKLSQNDLLRLVIPVPESSVSRIHLGAFVDLDVRALQKTFRGSVARFADRLDTETRTMRVEVDVKNPNLELVPGMYAVASLVIAEAKGVLVAPIEALDRAEDTPRVLIVNHDRRVEPRMVSIGLETEDRVEIKTGLDANDLVVVGNRARLKAGSLVAPKVTSERPEPGAR
jgi:RND family efflux transporter MFP subunit